MPVRPRRTRAAARHRVLVATRRRVARARVDPETHLDRTARGALRDARRRRERANVGDGTRRGEHGVAV